MTKDETQKFGEQIVSAIRSFVQRSLAERDKRLDALEAKQSQTLADAYRGAWGPNNHYTKGDVVNHRSSLWLCMLDTSAPPGSATEWRLLIKSPR